MITNIIKKTLTTQPVRYQFASAAAAAIDYYSLLGVQRGATKTQIQQAFARLTKNVNSETNNPLFSRLTEAFVILSDGKARDAYDSLMKVRKVSYLNQSAERAVSTPSYIADRKAERQRKGAQKYNIDQFGRYRGGVPNRKNTNRGRAQGQIGTLYHKQDLIQQDPFPEYTHVDQSTAESFKNFHQDQRVHRTAKPLWFTLQVDYQYFSFKRFMNSFSFWKYFIFFAFLLPIFDQKSLDFYKRYSKWSHDRKLRLKAQRLAKQKQQQQRQARQKQQKQRAQQQKLAKQAEAKQVQAKQATQQSN